MTPARSLGVRRVLPSDGSPRRLHIWDRTSFAWPWRLAVVAACRALHDPRVHTHLGPPRQELTTPRGALSIWLPRPGLLVTAASGHVTGAQAEAIIVAGDAARGDGSLLAFHDWLSLRTYDPEARVLLTAWSYKHRATVERAHLAVGSRLVRMGVSVASLVLGGMLVTYDDRAPFLAALDDALARDSSVTRP